MGRFTLSYRSLLLFGGPLLVGTLAGVYIFYKIRNSKSVSIRSKDAKCTKTITPSPLSSAVSIKNRGNKYFQAGRYDQAIQCYTEALEICPIDAVEERATFFQNRAAALENIRDYENAVNDCSKALECSPKYIKALKRRGNLYEKLKQTEKCLLDVTATCLFERFQNTDSVMSVERVLKLLAQEKAQLERPLITPTLPSSSFMQNYFNAFVWNPFTIEATYVMPANGAYKEEVLDERPKNSDEEESHFCDVGEDPNQDESSFELPVELLQAYDALDRACNFLESGSFKDSMQWAEKSVELFSNAPKVEANDFARSSLSRREPPLAAKARVHLLHITFMTISGCLDDIKRRLREIADNVEVHPQVRVNALIKMASYVMAIDQDINGCLRIFEEAQNVCPECPDVYLHRGQVNLLAERLDDSLTDFNMAVKLSPNFSVAQAQRLYTLYRRDMITNDMNRVDERIDSFEALAKKFSTCTETLSLYAQVLTDRGEFEKSDEQFIKILKLVPDSGMTYAYRGLLRLRWNRDHAGAAELFEKGYKVDPKCELIIELLGQMAMERNNFDEALNYFEMAIRLTKSMTDLTHLISLREAVKAQKSICSQYNLSVSEMFSSLQQEHQQNMIGLSPLP